MKGDEGGTEMRGELKGIEIFFILNYFSQNSNPNEYNSYKPFH